jgi:hypothetical protein
MDGLQRTLNPSTTILAREPLDAPPPACYKPLVLLTVQDE